jgi:hypothetical protein
VADVAVELDERAGVEELDETLAREQLALLALALDRLARSPACSASSRSCWSWSSFPCVESARSSVVAMGGA